MADRPIIAFREWGVEGDYRLAPRHQHFAGGQNPWENTGTAVARCPNLAEHDDIEKNKTPHVPGGERCTCGLYGYYDVVPPYDEPIFDHSIPERTRVRSGTVYGVYVAWGEVTKHRKGLRSQYARVVGLRWSPEAEKVAEVYGVPLCDTAGELRAAGLRYGTLFDPETLPAKGKGFFGHLGLGLARRRVMPLRTPAEQAALFNTFAGVAESRTISITCILVLAPGVEVLEERGLGMGVSPIRVKGIDENIWQVESFNIENEAVEVPLVGQTQVGLRPGHRIELTLRATQPEHLLDRALSDLTKVGTIYRVERGFPPGLSNHGL